MEPSPPPYASPGAGSGETPSRAASVTRPLVTVLITAHNRPDELGETLRAIRAQSYPAVELLVIDDCSTESLAPVVRSEAPEAVLWRNPANLGLVASRSLGMTRARGEYIVTLDDDSHLVAPDALEQAVRRMEREPRVGVVTFLLHEGLNAPADCPAGDEHYAHTFLGGANMMRRQAARDVGGFRDFFEYYSEESEYALRLIDRGWRILHFPRVVVHHRVSPIGRSAARIAAYSARNSIWTVLLNMPAHVALVEAPWKFMVGFAEIARRGQPRWAAWALASTVRGLPRVLRARTPISPAAVRTLRTLRFRDVRTAELLDDARPPSARERWRWFTTVWLRRRRPRAFWDRREGHLGASAWMTRPSRD